MIDLHSCPTLDVSWPISHSPHTDASMNAFANISKPSPPPQRNGGPSKLDNFP